MVFVVQRYQNEYKKKIGLSHIIFFKTKFILDIFGNVFLFGNLNIPKPLSFGFLAFNRICSFTGF